MGPAKKDRRAAVIVLVCTSVGSRWQSLAVALPGRQGGESRCWSNAGRYQISQSRMWQIPSPASRAVVRSTVGLAARLAARPRQGSESKGNEMNVQGDGVEVLGSGVRYYSAVPGTTGKMTLTGIGLGQCCVEKLDKFEAGPRFWPPRD